MIPCAYCKTLQNHSLFFCGLECYEKWKLELLEGNTK